MGKYNYLQIFTKKNESFFISYLPVFPYMPTYLMIYRHIREHKQVSIFCNVYVYFSIRIRASTAKRPLSVANSGLISISFIS